MKVQHIYGFIRQTGRSQSLLETIPFTCHSISPCPCLFVCAFVCVIVCLFVYSPCDCLFVCVFTVRLFVCLYTVRLFVCLYVYLFVWLFVCLYVYSPCDCLFVCVFTVRLFVCMCIHRAIVCLYVYSPCDCLFVCVFTMRLFVCLCVCLALFIICSSKLDKIWCSVCMCVRDVIKLFLRGRSWRCNNEVVVLKWHLPCSFNKSCLKVPDLSLNMCNACAVRICSIWVLQCVD